MLAFINALSLLALLHPHVQAFALFFDSIRYHFLAATGAAEGWATVFYVVTFCKSLLLFTVILLIGTGWSLVKPFLNAREKQVVAVVLVLQVKTKSGHTSAP